MKLSPFVSRFSFYKNKFVSFCNKSKNMKSSPHLLPPLKKVTDAENKTEISNAETYYKINLTNVIVKASEFERKKN